MADQKPVQFPYKSLEEATKDKFKKIGGPEQALRFLQKGFKTVQWRKRADASAKERDAAEDRAIGILGKE